MVMWNTFRELEALRREVERAFEEFGGGPGRAWRSAFLPGVSARRYPLVNVSDDNDNIYVEALAPGLDPASIEVTVVRDGLRISGEKTPISADIKREQYHRSERGSGRFVRTFTLPSEVDGDKVSAEYKDGLLSLSLPKHETAKPRQIEVSVG